METTIIAKTRAETTSRGENLERALKQATVTRTELSVRAYDDHDDECLSPLLVSNNNNTDKIHSNSPDYPLKFLVEAYKEAEPKCGDVKQQMAEIVEKRLHKKRRSKKMALI